MQNENKPFCAVCRKQLNSADQYSAHIGGAGHKRKVREQILEERSNGENSASEEGPTQKKIVLPIKPFVRSEEQQRTDQKENMDSTCSSQAVDGTNNSLSVLDRCKTIGPKQEIVDGSLRCDVCNVSNTSQHQAQAHYAGSKHQRNVARKQGLEPDKTQPAPGGKEVVVCSSLWDLERLMKFAQNNYQPPAAPANNAGDDKSPSGKAEITAGREDLWMRSKDVMCSMCVVRLTSKALAVAHFEGSKHQKRADRSQQVNRGDQEAWCSVCLVLLGSPSAAGTHYLSEKHMAKVRLAKRLGQVDPSFAARLNPPPAPPTGPPAPRKKRSGPPFPKPGSFHGGPLAKKANYSGGPGAGKQFGGTGPGKPASAQLYCTFCKVSVNSQGQMDAHRTGSKHMQTVAMMSGVGGGGPPKKPAPSFKGPQRQAPPPQQFGGQRFQASNSNAPQYPAFPAQGPVDSYAFHSDSGAAFPDTGPHFPASLAPHNPRLAAGFPMADTSGWGQVYPDYQQYS
ncbi:zinc finger protein 385B [Aplysia californica]|uniref:Zinc finger protein 385B n=1 Tax=Aplysia californica TaxID=6500 RepID=A0ABM0KAM2_APLCA|nr:zinc finger protein 385B [Aplysia californica]